MKPFLVGMGAAALSIACGFSVLHDWQAWAIIISIGIAAFFGGVKKP